MIWQFLRIVTFDLSITYTYWTLVDAWVKKYEHLENQNVTWTPNNIFDFLNFCSFSPGGFFTFLVVVAHGAAALVPQARGNNYLENAI